MAREVTDHVLVWKLMGGDLLQKRKNEPEDKKEDRIVQFYL